jgi:hypothetical protein
MEEVMPVRNVPESQRSEISRRRFVAEGSDHVPVGDHADALALSRL